MVPERIDVVGNHIHKPKADIGLKLTAGKGTGTALIQLSDQGKLCLVAALSILRVAGAFIENPPDVNAGMIVMRLNHLPDTVLTLPFKIRISHGLLGQPSGMVFLPDKDSLFVAQIQKKLLIGIMGGSHGISSQILHNQDILPDGFQRKTAAELGMILVTAKAPDPKLTAIQKNILAPNFHLAKSETLHKIVYLLTGLILENSRKRIKRRILRAPLPHIPADKLCADHGRLIRRKRYRKRSRYLSILSQHKPQPARKHFLRQVPDTDFHLRLPAVRRLIRRYMDPLYISIPNLLQRHGPGDPAVGLVIIWHVKGRMLPKAVVHTDLQPVLPRRHILHHR